MTAIIIPGEMTGSGPFPHPDVVMQVLVQRCQSLMHKNHSLLTSALYPSVPSLVLLKHHSFLAEFMLSCYFLSEKTYLKTRN